MHIAFPKREYTENYRELKATIGIMTIFHLEPYGVLPDLINGVFFSDKVPLSVVSEHSELHIISIVDCSGEVLTINRHAENACFYYLGNGNSDPTLELFRDPRPPKGATEVPLEVMLARAPTKADEERIEKLVRVSENLFADRHPFAGVYTPAELAGLRARTMNRLLPLDPKEPRKVK